MRMYVPFFLVFWKHQQRGIMARTVSRTVPGMETPRAMASFFVQDSQLRQTCVLAPGEGEGEREVLRGEVV